MAWTPDSWRSFEARQQPAYDDPGALESAERVLQSRPSLVGIDEIDALKAALAEAQAGRAFLLQGGDCAESLEGDTAGKARATVRLLEGMAAAVEAASILPVVAVGRIAGQFAKPRSAEVERRGDAALPVYRGDGVNGLPFDAEARRADPERMIRVYERSAATLAWLRREAPALATSHEALLLPYEQALVRNDPASGRAFGGSGHMLWIGERTRFAGSAHVELVRGLANPIGVKCGPTLGADALMALLDRLDPDGQPGRITLIGRMGAAAIERALPPLLAAVRRSGRPVLWACDPMHGNTVHHDDGAKTRSLGDIRAETLAFFRLAAAEGVFGGGLHLELTGEDVAECGEAGVPPAGAYLSACDPRLNAAQAMALAGLAGREIAGGKSAMSLATA